MNAKQVTFPEFSWGSVAIFCLAIAATIGIVGAFTPISYGFCLLAIVIVMTGRIEYVFLLLLLTYGLNEANLYVFPRKGEYIMAGRITLFALTVAVGFFTLQKGRGEPRVMSPFLWLFLYLAYMGVTSMFGWHPPISELKILLFSCFLFVIVNCSSIANKTTVDLRLIRAGVLSLALLFVVGSILVWRFSWSSLSPGEAREFNLGSDLYRGTTLHSQVLGPLCAMLNTILLCDYLVSLKKRNWLYLLVFAAAPLLIYKSSSRTGMITYLASTLACFFFVLSSKSVSSVRKRKVWLVVLGGGFLVLCLFAVIPQSTRYAEQFIRKESVDETRSSGSWSNRLLSSREGLMAKSMENFRDSPWIGNGFQVSKEMESQSLNILSAPVEKGFFLTMVLEEGGILGGIIFALFLATVYLKYMKLHFVCFLSTFTCMIIANCGEAIIFSSSHVGGICWILCMVALVLDVQREKAASMHQTLPAP